MCREHWLIFPRTLQGLNYQAHTSLTGPKRLKYPAEEQGHTLCLNSENLPLYLLLFIQFIMFCKPLKKLHHMKISLLLVHAIIFTIIRPYQCSLNHCSYLEILYKDTEWYAQS